MLACRMALCATVLTLGLGGNANAQDIGSGNFWLPVCGDENNPMCGTYIKGADDFRLLASVAWKVYCKPANVTVNQQRLVLLKWLKDHPAELHKPIIILFVDAMRDAFPCPTSK